jgi:hypothetical protein
MKNYMAIFNILKKTSNSQIFNMKNAKGRKSAKEEREICSEKRERAKGATQRSRERERGGAKAKQRKRTKQSERERENKLYTFHITEKP